MKKYLKDGRIKHSCDICRRGIYYDDPVGNCFGIHSYKFGKKIRPWKFYKTDRKDKSLGIPITLELCEDCLKKVTK